MLDDDDLIVGTKTVVRPFWRRLFLAVVLIAVVAPIGGFIWFTSQIATQAPAHASLTHADGIVVLTGGQTRIEESFSLLRDGKGARLLISGVDNSTDKEGLRARVGGDQNDQAGQAFDCCVDIEHVASDTQGNAAAAAKWANDNGFDSLIMVTSAYHVPRAMLIFKAHMPDLTLTAYPVPSEAVPTQEWYKHGNTTLFLLDEYAKTVWTWITIQKRDLIGG